MENLLAGCVAYLVQTCHGSLGAGIIVLSLTIRLGLWPLNLWLARRSLRNQALARAFQPELEGLRKRFGQDPRQLFRETRKLHQKYNYRPADPLMLLGGLLQWPIFALLYRTIRDAVKPGGGFLWIRSLAAPDMRLTFLILALTALTAYWLPNASANGRVILISIQVFITSLVVWKLAAGLGLYWATSNAVGLLQSWWLRRTTPPLQSVRP